MPEYTVSWSITIEAKDPTEAALLAEDVQAEQVSTRGNGGVFTVMNNKTKEKVQVDLAALDTLLSGYTLDAILEKKT